MPYERFMLAAGHDNPLSLQYLHDLPLASLADFTLGPEVEWQDSEGEEYDGDNQLVLIGPQRVIVHLGSVYTAEHVYLRATYATSGPRTGPVTVQIHDRDTDTWPIYNALLELPKTSDLEWLFGGWKDYPVTLYDLELLWEEADAPTVYVFSDGSFVTFSDGSTAIPGV